MRSSQHPFSPSHFSDAVLTSWWFWLALCAVALTYILWITRNRG